MARPPLHPNGKRHLLTLSLPPDLVDDLRAQVGETALAPAARNLLAEALGRRASILSDLTRIAGFARSLDRIPTNPMYERQLRLWALDLVRQLPALPANPDWAYLVQFIGNKAIVAPSTRELPMLTWIQKPAHWRQEWWADLPAAMGGHVTGKYGIASQPSRTFWSVNFYGENGNIHAVDGMVTADTLQAAQMACQRDAAERL